jgi:hypothetical protein
MAGIGARRSAFPVGKPHTAMRGAFALCDSPHGVMRRRGAASAKQGYGHDEQRTTNNEHAITLTDAELNEVVGGLNPQPPPPGPPPELSRSIFSIFRSFGINQHFTFTSVFRSFSF